MSRCNTCPNREGNKCVVFDAPVCDKTLITCLEYDLYNWNETLTKYKRAFEILKEIFDIRFEKDKDGDCWIKIFPKTYDDRHILGEPTSEQYELLEELMNNV